MIKLAIIDADRTIWTHHDASALIPPFELITHDIVRDRYGSRVELHEGFRAFLDFVKGNGIFLSLASWNEPENVFELLSLFNVDRYFVSPIAEPHPNKHLMLKKIIMNLNKKGISILPNEILFVDDNDRYLGEIKEAVGDVSYLKYGVDVRNWVDVVNKIKEYY
jgi:magnesium-dependent phosphatase-1